jgi:hypothetical protein
MVRKNNTILAVNNKTPKTRRGRKKTKHLTVLKGGWDGEYNDEIPWLAEDLFMRESVVQCYDRLLGFGDDQIRTGARA